MQGQEHKADGYKQKTHNFISAAMNEQEIDHEI